MHQHYNTKLRNLAKVSNPVFALDDCYWNEEEKYVY